MSNFPMKLVVDTNVPIAANLSSKSELISDIPDSCISQCISAIDQIMKNGGLVLDDNGEIFKEYITNLPLGGQPGIGYAFTKWVYVNQWDKKKIDRVKLTKNGKSYNEFPDTCGLIPFDNSDRKFIAVSNAHPDKPQILQATDSKWLGWEKALGEVGIIVLFLCRDYVKAKYMEKMDS